MSVLVSVIMALVAIVAGLVVSSRMTTAKLWSWAAIFLFIGVIYLVVPDVALWQVVVLTFGGTFVGAFSVGMQNEAEEQETRDAS